MFFEHRGLLEGRERRRSTTPARRASSIRSSPRRERDLEAVRRGRAPLGADEGARRSASCAARRSSDNRDALVAPPPALRRASTRGASCSRSATAARRPTRWTWWRTSAPPTRWPPRRALDLTEDPAILTAIANDIGTEAIFARQVIAHGREGDALLAISTSGNSRERDRRARRGAPARPADDRDGRLRRRARRRGAAWPTTWSSRARSTSRASRRRRRAPTTCCASWSELAQRDPACRRARSRARCRASASGPTSTGSPASSAWPATC